MGTVKEVRRAQQAEGPAMILAIGTANPSNCVDQSTYHDYYFRVTNNEHEIELKQKFERICNKTTIKKRHLHLTEEILKKNPDLCSFTAPTLNFRHDIVVEEVPKLGKEAAVKAIGEWGQPKSDITHLVFCTTTGVDLPGADYQLVNLLGLRPSVKRFMMHHQGCGGGATALRLVKDLAENNAGARVLLVCAEITLMIFRGPSDDHLGNLVGQAIFGDGAAAMIVGSDPVAGVERPIFQLVSTVQTTLPNCEWAIDGHLRESGLVFDLHKNVSKLISEDIDKSLKEAFDPFGISDWNSIFWAVHPGGPAILDRVEAKLALKPEKFRSARHVLSEYGNMSSTTVLFVLDEIRKASAEQGLSTTGEGLDWGVLFGFGPGITIELMVLRSVPIN